MPNTQLGRLLSLLHLAVFYCSLIICFLLFSPAHLFAQRPAYHIEVSLDTTTHELSGFELITYRNPSSAPLDSLGIHLWANAYADNNSAFAKQLLDLGHLHFQYAKPEELGGYNQIDFTSNQERIELHIDHQYQDVGWLILAKPLQPNEEIKIKVDFVLKIPISFSRIGRTGDSYQLTQWYPHLAVYDQEGWHTMPYLDQGEYFNDFADYQVNITLPSGYIIASTGMLQDKQELGEKTQWNFMANNVIDFAWFANPHFKVIEKNIQNENAEPYLLSLYVDTMSTVSWDSALLYGERALDFYSDWLGPYPYPHMSIISAPWSKGGYMEYPMIAQIGITEGEDFLDIVIAHEVGHAWLYSILANDERSNPWMDEGLNTFFERKYAQQYYPGYNEPLFSPFFRTVHSMPDDDALQHTMIYTHQLAPPASDPQFQSSNQYLFSAYLLPAEGLEMMQSSLGESKMKTMFRQYFQDRQFTHVSPVDLRVTFEQKCTCDLSWFFDDWIHFAHQVDYRIKKFKPKVKEVTLVNKGNSDLPVQITTFMDGKPVASYWLDGFRGQKIFHLDQRADEVKLFKDAPVVNKIWGRNTAPSTLLPHITLIPKVGDYDRYTWSISPFIGHNLSDGIMLGPVIMSDLFPQHHFKWTIAPLYGLESKEIRGYGEIRYSSDFAKGLFDKMLISLSVNHFGYDVDTFYDFREHYLRISPTIAFRTPYNEDHPHLTQWWKYRYVNIHQYYAESNGNAGDNYEKTRSYGVHELSYSIRSDYIIQPYLASLNSQWEAGFIKFNLNYQQHFTGKDKMKGLWMHVFAGYQRIDEDHQVDSRFTLSGTPFSSLGYNSSDYMYDEWLGGRNAETGLFSQQVFMKDAGFKTLAYNDVSSTWMTAGGLSYALPFKMFHLYMDAAFYHSDLTLKSKFSYSGGVALIILKDVLEVYLPLVESKDIQESITYDEKDIWYKRISFQANIRLMNPMDVADRATLRY